MYYLQCDRGLNNVICQCTKFQMSRNQMIQIIIEKKIIMNKTNKNFH